MTFYARKRARNHEVQRPTFEMSVEEWLAQQRAKALQLRFQPYEREDRPFQKEHPEDRQ